MKNKENVELAYKSLIKTLKKNDGLTYLNLRDVEYNMKLDLLRIELEELGFENHIYGLKYENLYNHWVFYTHFEEGDGYSISWSDDGRQPKNERLIKFAFSTGAYIFGDFYPKETFNEFFLELQKYNPLYSDSANSSLYFSLEDGARLYKDFKELYAKYRNLALERNKENKIMELQKEIDKLTK